MIRILLLISESWNDVLHPNNNMTNWFYGIGDIEIYTVSCGAEDQINSCCKDYFQVSDFEMMKALLPFKKAGRAIHYDLYPNKHLSNELSRLEEKMYSNRGRMHSWLPRLIRDFIWRYGTYDIDELQKFIGEFKPDIIFSQRMGSVKMCRLEHVVHSLTDAPMIAYTGDNEYFVNAVPESFLGKLHVLWTRRWLDKQIPSYSLYYSMSKEQMKLYKNKYRVETDFLVKCGNFESVKPHSSVNEVIQIVYAGKIYAGRWKTLSLLINTILDINKQEKKQFYLSIYTQDRLDEEQRIILNRTDAASVYEAVPSEKLKGIYDVSDIVLHVEGLDKTDVEATRYSFSTKVIDCLSSGCALMAICDEKQAAFSYLRENDIAFTASNKGEISDVLSQIAHYPEAILEYSNKAIEFGKKHHQRECVQKKLKQDFEKVMIKNKC